MTTSTAETSFMSFGFSPASRASWMTTRYSTEPSTTASVAIQIRRVPKIAWPMMTEAEAGQDQADAHADVGKALVLGNEGPAECDQAVGQRQAEDLLVVGADAEAADHLFVVAGGLHGQSDVGVQEPVHDHLHRQRDQQEDRRWRRCHRAGLPRAAA